MTRRTRIQHRYLVAGTSLTIFFCGVLVGVQYLSTEKFVQQMQALNAEGAMHAGRSAASRKIETMAASLADALELPLYKSDFEASKDILKSVMADVDTDFVYVVDHQGRLFHDGSQLVEGFGKPIKDLLPAWCQPQQWAITDIGKKFCFIEPIYVGTKQIGEIYIGINSTLIEKDVATASSSGQKLVEVLRAQQIKQMIALALIAIFGGLLLSYLIARSMAKPIRALAESAKNIAEGDTSASLQVDRTDELGVLGESLQEMKNSLIRGQKDLEHAANFDLLTDIPNRHSFAKAAEKWISHANKTKECVALLYIDLNKFKEVNDSYGHTVGDAVLREQARRMFQSAQSRKRIYGGDSGADEDNLNSLFRVGGDEFALFMTCDESASAINNVTHTAERILKALKATIVIDSIEFNMDASIGVARCPEDATTLISLLKCADMAMYSAKQNKTGQIAFYNSKIAQEVERQTQTRRALKKAIEEDQLQLVYQPIYDLQTGQACSCEALLRWTPKNGQPVDPTYFIPLAVDHGLIQPLTNWVLQRAERDFAQWEGSVLDTLCVSLNVPFADLDLDATMAAIKTLRESGPLSQRPIRIEITETSLIANPEEVTKTLDGLRQLGCEVWLDDFGTGYSSLSYLHRFPLDGIKIDRQFITDLHKNPDGFKLVQSIISMASTLGLKVVAEGVDHAEQQNILSKLGCDYVQGFLYQKGLNLAELATAITDPKLSQCA